MLPLVIVFTYLLILLTLNLVNYFDEGLAKIGEQQREVYNIVSSLFWSMILFAACFEWEAITFLVKF